LRESVELRLAWQRVNQEISQGALGEEISHSDRANVRAMIRDAEEVVKDEVWGGYRYVVLSDSSSTTGLKVIDLGAGHSSANESLTARVIAALRSDGLLNESVGAGYIGRHWSPAFKESGAWPLVSLRQSFLDGSLTRLRDPDQVLREQVKGWVEGSEFGLASGGSDSGTFSRVWFREAIGEEEIVFESGVFLLTREKAESVKQLLGRPAPEPEPSESPEPRSKQSDEGEQPDKPVESLPDQQSSAKSTLRINGMIPPEAWNRFGRSVLPMLQAGDILQVNVDIWLSAHASDAGRMETDVRQALGDLMLSDALKIETEEVPEVQ